MNSKILIITGAPATGKTSIMKLISDQSGVIAISKDEIKETLFDNFIDISLETSKKLGIASFHTVFLLLEKFAKKNISIIIEANFRPEFDEDLVNEIVKKYNVNVMQILCEASSETILKRLQKRKESGERHEGHFDLGREEEFKELIDGGSFRFFDIPNAKNITLQTDKFIQKEIDRVVFKAGTFLESSQS